jgi:chemotaxis signal transduction protein
MRYFICAFDELHIGIPAECAERIIPLDEADSSQTAYISLAGLCGQKEPESPHGLVLKTKDSPALVLRTPKIKTDMELPEEGIRELPRVFAGILRYFRGVYMDASRMILVLDPQTIKGDQAQ